MINPDQKDWVKRIALIKFVINSSTNSATGLVPFKINYRYMPVMIRTLKDKDSTPPGVRTFAQNALRNITLAHDALIEVRVFQQHHADKRWHDEPNLKEDDLVYLSTKNLAMPKGRASKLVPKFVGPYKITKALPSTSNYTLELPEELAKRQVHLKFHVSLLRPHYPNDDVLFPNRMKAEPYDFGTPEDAEWYVNEIVRHCWKGRNIEFLVKWNLGDSTWESLSNCNELAAMDGYLMLMDVRDWQELPRKVTHQQSLTKFG